MAKRDRPTWGQYFERRKLELEPVTSNRVTAPAPGRNKYGAKPATVDGIRFDSTKESRRYGELRLLEKAGLIRNLGTQPRFPLDVIALATGECIRCGVFTADFHYVDVATDKLVIEDTKSDPTKTEAYRLRKRLVEAIHGVKISEV